MPRLAFGSAEPFVHRSGFTNFAYSHSRLRSCAVVRRFISYRTGREPFSRHRYFVRWFYQSAIVNLQALPFKSSSEPCGACSSSRVKAAILGVRNLQILSPSLNAVVSSEVSMESSMINPEAYETSAVVTLDNSITSFVGSKARKRSKRNSEEALINLKLNTCSKRGDLHGALALFDHVKKTGTVQLKLAHYNSLLYLCSGAASGSLTKGGRREEQNKGPSKAPDEPMEQTSGDLALDKVFREGGNMIKFSKKDIELAAGRGIDIYEDMLRQKIEPNEATFTAIARLAAAKGDGDLAFEIVKAMTSLNIAPKLRSYGPPLLHFCENNQVEKAFEVYNYMLSCDVSPDEPLLEALLKMSVEAELDDKVYLLLHRIRMTVREVSVSGVSSTEQWFKSKAAAYAGKALWDRLPSMEEVRSATQASGGGWHGLGWLGKGQWDVSRTTITKQGTCNCCGQRLCTIDLDPEETENFAKSIAALACERERRPHEFRAFQNWLKQHGPFEAIIDGANVGLYHSQNNFKFDFFQINAVLRAINSRISGRKKTLVILHSRRTSNPGSIPSRAEPMVKQWIEGKMLYSTPHRSNDDWYWLYAAVSCKSLIVTNDEMRDHIFQLLGNDFFPKWKERHQVRFAFTSKSLDMHMPPPYSVVIQESESGSWHIPQMGGDDIETPREWLCVTRPERHHIGVGILEAPLAGASESIIERHAALSTGPTAPLLCSRAPSSLVSHVRIGRTLKKLNDAEKHSDVLIDFQI